MLLQVETKVIPTLAVVDLLWLHEATQWNASYARVATRKVSRKLNEIISRAGLWLLPYSRSTRTCYEMIQMIRKYVNLLQFMYNSDNWIIVYISK